MSGSVPMQGPGEPSACESQGDERAGWHSPAQARFGSALGRWARGRRATSADCARFPCFNWPDLATPICNSGLVNVLLLGIVNAHEAFDGFDDPLRVPDHIAVRLIWVQAIRQARQEPRQMTNLAMCAAHREKAIAVGEETR